MADSTQQKPMLQDANQCDRLINDGADVTLRISKGSELEATPSKFDKLPRPENSVLHMSSSTSREMTRRTNASDTDGKFMGRGPFDSMLYASEEQCIAVSRTAVPHLSMPSRRGCSWN